VDNFIVIGGGSAGCVIASRLSEDPSIHVTLMEAGPATSHIGIDDPKRWHTLGGSVFDWAFTTSCQKYTAGRKHQWPRGKILGGSSSINAMAHVRGHPSDFDDWKNDGCNDWSYDDLLPYFIKSETSAYSESPYHGATGPLQLMQPDSPHEITQCFLAAAEGFGMQPIAEHNGAKMLGPTLNTLNIVDNKRQSAADAYLRPALARNNITVVDNCLVDRLLINKNGGCIGVTYIKNGNTNEIYSTAGVILCAGAIGSPQILLRSGIGCAKRAQKLGIQPTIDLPGVGQNLHDHCLGAGNMYLSRRALPKSQYQHSESLLYVDTKSSCGKPDIVLACVVLPVATEQFELPTDESAYTIMYGVTSPKSRGMIELQSTDPFAHPIIDPNYLGHPEDRISFIDALDFAREIGASSMLSEWRKSEHLPGPNIQSIAEKTIFNAQAAFTHHHPVGTCRMGTDSTSVVSPRLQVHGIENLFVVDASIMPKITSGPTNAAVVAIAEKASDIIQNRSTLQPVTIKERI
tara:strand:+ start:3001 stop:4554 length:1554 start_codon:yes stop_codon:yes gene_type:complete